MTQSRYRSRLYFAYRIGQLQFKDYRKGEFTRIYGDVKCFMEGCEEKDDLEHVMRCQKYPADLRCELTNFNYDPDEQEEFMDYLERLDKFRAMKFNLPVLFRPSLKKRLERQLKNNLLDVG